MDSNIQKNLDEVLRVTQVCQLIADLRLGKINGSHDRAMKTIEVIEKAVNHLSWQTAQELISIMFYLGDVLTNADPTENVPRNTILRVLKEVRSEYETSSNPTKTSIGFNSDESLPKMMVTDDDSDCDYTQLLPNLKESIIDFLSELKSELETSRESIAVKSLEQISSDQVILTSGKSQSVETFLKFASNKMKFEIIVVEGGPSRSGHDLALSLIQFGIKTTLIPDSAIFAVMSRVNKVVIGTHSVMANGGLKAISGTYTLALAAKHYSVPLIVCTPMYKITPQYLVSHDQVAFNKLGSPHLILPFHESPYSTNCEVLNPVFDYVPPELIDSFVTNWGCNSPSYIYRLLSELYHRKDYLQ